MSQARSEVGAAHRVGSGIGRLMRAWRGLPPERRLAAIAAIGLFLTLFLPWYQVTVIATGVKNLQSASASLTGWGAFSFVEAAVLLVAAGVLTLLFQRAEGRAFHLPGGDGWVIMAAGFWTCLLVVWRMFDKQGTTPHGQYADTYGIEWGIFVALGVAALLAYSGSRIRAAHRPEPPLPGEDSPTDPLPQPPARRANRRNGSAKPAAAAAPATAATAAPAAAERPEFRARTAEHYGRAPAATPAADPPTQRPDPPAREVEHLDPPADPPEFTIRRAVAADPRAAEAATQHLERPPAKAGPSEPPPANAREGEPPAGAPESPDQPARGRVRPPRPVRAADPATKRLGTPATPAARAQPPAPEDDQLTIPLDQD